MTPMTHREDELLPQVSENLPELIELRRKKATCTQVSFRFYFAIRVGGGTGGRSDGLFSSIFTASFQPRMHYIVSEDYLFVAYNPDLCLAPMTPHIPSPLARTDALPLASNHPHARKQSVLDGQFSLDVLSPTTSVPTLHYSSTST